MPTHLHPGPSSAAHSGLCHLASLETHGGASLQGLSVPSSLGMLLSCEGFCIQGWVISGDWLQQVGRGGEAEDRRSWQSG